MDRPITAFELGVMGHSFRSESRVICPDCGADLMEGPTGGMGMNMRCDKCGVTFNVGFNPFSQDCPLLCAEVVGGVRKARTPEMERRLRERTVEPPSNDFVDEGPLQHRSAVGQDPLLSVDSTRAGHSGVSHVCGDSMIRRPVQPDDICRGAFGDMRVVEGRIVCQRCAVGHLAAHVSNGRTHEPVECSSAEYSQLNALRNRLKDTLRARQQHAKGLAMCDWEMADEIEVETLANILNMLVPEGFPFTKAV